MDDFPKHRLDPDMSEPALNRRLKRLEDLYQLALSLRKAEPRAKDAEKPLAVREHPAAYPAEKRER